MKLAGFKLVVVKTASAGHAKKLASTVDITTCPDGIICVGGDGIINEVLADINTCPLNVERTDLQVMLYLYQMQFCLIPEMVLNGLLHRDNQNEGISIPIGIIPAAAGSEFLQFTGLDCSWSQRSSLCYNFYCEVLELSEKYQKRFGPLRYFAAGFQIFLWLPKYNYEVEYLPAAKEDQGGKNSVDREVVDMSDTFTQTL